MEPGHGRIEALLEQAELLARLVQGLRTLTLAEASKVLLEREPLDLADLALSTVDAFAARASQLDVTHALDASSVQVDAGSVHLRQIAGNLIENAVRHAPAGGRVDVRVTRRAQGGAPRGARRWQRYSGG